MEVDRLLLDGLFYLLGYVVAALLGSPIISRLLSRYEREDFGMRGAGMMIGIIERVLIVTLVYVDEIAAISLVLTAKSIIRFPEASRGNKSFAEYYLIGTLTSVTMALLVGLIFEFLIRSRILY